MKTLFNPLMTDFSVEWFDDDNKSHILKMRSMEFTKFEDYQSEFVKKHLADEIYNVRGSKQTDKGMLNYDDQRISILKEIEVS